MQIDKKMRFMNIAFLKYDFLHMSGLHKEKLSILLPMLKDPYIRFFLYNIFMEE